MRDVKFEVFDNGTQTILEYGTFRLEFDGHGIWRAYKSIPEGRGDMICNDKSGYIREYVGIKDCNGKEVYEGDIDENGMIVTYCGNQESGLDMNVGWYLQTGDFEKWIELESRDNDNKDNHKIVGNIYENPELLNQES